MPIVIKDDIVYTFINLGFFYILLLFVIYFAVKQNQCRLKKRYIGKLCTILP